MFVCLCMWGRVRPDLSVLRNYYSQLWTWRLYQHGVQGILQERLNQGLQHKKLAQFSTFYMSRNKTLRGLVINSSLYVSMYQEKYAKPSYLVDGKSILLLLWEIVMISLILCSLFETVLVLSYSSQEFLK